MTAKRHLAWFAALAAVAAIAPPTALGQSACCYPQRANDIEFSVDGRFAYAVSYETVAVRRDPVSGALETVDMEGAGGEGAVLSPDGRHLYAGINIFARDPVTGKLDQVAYWRDEASPYADLDDAVFRDDHTLYVSDERTGTLKVLTRDAATGALATRRAIPAGPGPRQGPRGLVLSPDRGWLYAADGGPSGGIAAFRVLDDGDLEPMPEAGCDCPGNGRIAMAPDGSRIARGPNSRITTVERAPDGTLHTARTVESTPHQEQGGNLTFTPDGRSLLAVEEQWGYRGELVQYDNASAGLVPKRRYGRGEGVVGAFRVATPSDGRHVYTASGTELVNPSTISVHEWNADGELTHASTYSSPLYTGRPYGGPPPQVFINGGAPYTNDPEVELTFAGLGSRDREIEISNDGGFTPSETRPFALGTTYPWTLASTGPDRLPKTVYVRVTGPGVDTLTDEIVLDETAPVVVSARRAGGKLKVRVRDRISGVSHVQVTRNPRRPGKWRKYRSTVGLPSGRGGIHVRARDRARNRSRWVAAR